MKDYSENLHPLTQENETQLKKNIVGLLFMLVVIGGIGFVFYQFMPDFKSAKIVMSSFGILIVLLIMWMIRGYYLDFDDGQKYIIRGRVANITTRFGKQGTGAKRKILIGDKEIKVDFNQQRKLETGDLAEIHYGPHSKFAFSVILLEAAQSQKDLSNSALKSERKAETKTSAGTLRHEDIKVLKRLLWRNIKFNLILLLFSSWLIAGLWVGGMPFVLVFLFPIPILFLISIVRIATKVIRHLKDINEEAVLIVTTLATNKSTVSVRTSYKYTVVTDAYVFRVAENLYNKVRPVEQVELRVTKKYKNLIGIKLESGEFVENR